MTKDLSAHVTHLMAEQRNKHAQFNHLLACCNGTAMK